LTNGIELDNGIAVKNFKLEYSQSLGEITNILQDSPAQTTLISRLAKYHMDNRKDPANNCQDFYKFLNGHFERKIMCVRENIFEYAMSWSIRDRSGVLNVYGKEDRDKVSQVSEVDESYFIKKCQDYVSYQNWIETNFPNIQKISYEDMLTNSDSIMETLTGYENTFTNHFGITLNSIIKKEYSFLQSAGDLSNEEARGLVRYRLTSKDMINKGIIFNLPLKNTTLTDKKKQIKNFDACLDKFYKFAKNHNWIDQSKATYDFWNEEHIC
tara:strand:- start:746 stop:1552 length:807 start_codon:yes stop_codon:yes gene_type:complete